MRVEMNRPTIPIFKLLLGLPSRTFFSAAGAFLGGILFLTEPCAAGEEKKNLQEENE